MSIDGIIILDSSGHAVIQSGFRGLPTAFPLLHIAAVNEAVSRSCKAGDVDPVIYVPSSFGSSHSPSVCCHIQVEDIRVLCPLSGDTDPGFAFEFMRTFLDILKEYFGSVTAAVMRDNFDIVYQLLEETLDSGGHPLTTDVNALRDIVLPPTLISKLLANVTASGTIGSAGGAAFSSPIPWRKTGLRYNNNEIYFDMVEEIISIVNKNGGILSSVVYGKIQTNAKLSGMPDLLVSFGDPNVMTDLAFHPCVRIQRWNRDQKLSFIPPDGNFTLAEYRFVPKSSATSNAGNSLRGELIPIPIGFKHKVDLQDFGGTFELTLTSKFPRPIEKASVELYLGEDATSVQASTTGVGQWASSNGPKRGSAETSWTFSQKTKTLRWDIPEIAQNGSHTLRGSFITSSKNARPGRAFRIRFAVHQFNFSSLKLGTMQLSGEHYKPYKGVRASCTGDIDWRW